MSRKATTVRELMGREEERAGERNSPPIASQKTYISSWMLRGGRASKTEYTNTGIPVRDDWCARFFVSGKAVTGRESCQGVQKLHKNFMHKKGGQNYEAA